MTNTDLHDPCKAHRLLRGEGSGFPLVSFHLLAGLPAVAPSANGNVELGLFL